MKMKLEFSSPSSSFLRQSQGLVCLLILLGLSSFNKVSGTLSPGNQDAKLGNKVELGKNSNKMGKAESELENLKLNPGRAGTESSQSQISVAGTATTSPSSMPFREAEREGGRRNSILKSLFMGSGGGGGGGKFPMQMQDPENGYFFGRGRDEKRKRAGAYVKKPGNEEVPTVSDNANSEKGFSPEDVFFGGEDQVAGADFKRKMFLDPLTQEDELLGKKLMENDGLNYNTDYRPYDIAEYIFWTGNEKGVTDMILDFLQEGLVDKDEVINFLEEVKRELNALRAKFPAFQHPNKQFSENLQTPIFRTGAAPNFEEYLSPQQMDEQILSGGRNGNGWNDIKKRSQSQSQRTMREYSLGPNNLEEEEGGLLHKLEDNGSDYNYAAELLAKLQSSDLKFREKILLDVIYQLAKELFISGTGGVERDDTFIEKLSLFLETEAVKGRIPKDLTKLILDMLVGALVEANSDFNTNLQNPLKSKSQAFKKYFI